MSVSDDTTRAEVALTKRNLHQAVGDGANGSQEAYIDQHSIQSNDGRSRTRTTFYWWEAPPGKREQYENLAEWNDGVQDKDRASHNWERGKLNDAELFCEHLDFTKQEAQKVTRMTKDIDFDAFGSFTVEQVLVGCCSLVADENTENFEDRIITRDEFKELMGVVGIGSTEHRRVRKGIRDRTDYF